MSYLSSIWKNKSINTRGYLNTIFVLIIMYIFIFHIFSPLGNKFESIRNIDRICLMKQDDSIWKNITKKSRGNEYYITPGTVEDDYSIDQCGMTIWEGSHIFSHIFIGYWLDLRWSLGIGIAFEAWEWYAYGCENYLDVLYNTIGAIIGSMMRICMKKKKYDLYY